MFKQKFHALCLNVIFYLIRSNMLIERVMVANHWFQLSMEQTCPNFHLRYIGTVNLVYGINLHIKFDTQQSIERALGLVGERALSARKAQTSSNDSPPGTPSLTRTNSGSEYDSVNE